MKIYINKKDNGYDEVYSDDVLVGYLRKFCCGIDFRPIKKQGSLFSILKVRNYSDRNLIKSLRFLIPLKLPKKAFHVNFNPEILSNKDKIESYKKSLIEY